MEYFQAMWRKYMNAEDKQQIMELLNIQDDRWLRYRRSDIERIFELSSLTEVSITTMVIDSSHETIAIRSSAETEISGSKKRKRRKRKTNYYKNQNKEDDEISETSSVADNDMWVHDKKTPSANAIIYSQLFSAEQQLVNDMLRWFDDQHESQCDLLMKVKRTRYIEGEAFEEEERICVDKAILAVRSPYFRAMINIGLQESTQEEIEMDVDYDTLVTLLRYIYGGYEKGASFVERYKLDNCHQQVLDLKNSFATDAELLDKKNACDVFVMANLYSLFGLKVQAEKFMGNQMYIGNLQDLHEISKLYNGEYLTAYTSVCMLGKVITCADVRKDVEQGIEEHRKETSRRYNELRVKIGSNVTAPTVQRNWGTINWADHFK